MAKPLTFLVLLAIACLSAGLFGMVHNQLSYSVGASYFHEFKFAQFAIDGDLQNRLGAALVGWRASWWMGLLIGIPAFGLGLVLLRPARLLPVGLAAIGITVTLALAGAMVGLTLGMIAPSYAPTLPLPDGVTDPDSFLRAALMHEGAYLGGVLGCVAALVTTWRARRLPAEGSPT